MDYIKKYEESSSLRSIRSLNCSNDFVTVGFVCIIDRFINRRPFFFWVWLFLSSALRFRAKREFSASLFFCSYNSAFRRRSISRWAGFSNRCCLHSKISSANQRRRWTLFWKLSWAAWTLFVSNCSSSIIRSINRVSTEKQDIQKRSPIADWKLWNNFVFRR